MSSETSSSRVKPQSSGSGSDAATMMRYDANKKSALIAYVLWFFLGYLGAHRFYLGHTGTGVAILLLTIASCLLAFVMIGLVLIIIALQALAKAAAGKGLFGDGSYFLLRVLAYPQISDPEPWRRWLAHVVWETPLLLACS